MMSTEATNVHRQSACGCHWWCVGWRKRLRLDGAL